MDWKGVEQFVGEDAAGGNARGDFDGGAALPFLNEIREMRGKSIAAGGRTFNSDVAKRLKKIGELGLREFEDVTGEAACSGGRFEEEEFARAIEVLPHFGELAGR